MVEKKTGTKEPNKKRVSPISGCPPPDGFEKYPERRHNGAWKKEDTPRYKLEKMMVLPRTELLKVIGDEKAPYFERKIAKCLIKGDWKTVESMINQVYGQPKQSVETIDLTPPKPLSPRKQNDKSA